MKTKKIITCILATCTMLSALSLQGVSTVTGMADDGVMRDDMTAQDYADEMGLGINLGNTMEGYWLDLNKQYSGAQTIGNNRPQNYETSWGAVVTTQEIINGMKDAGFNTIRIPVYWGNMMEEDGTYTINSEFIGRVKEIVDYCRNAGVYTVINMHHYDEFVIRHFSTFGTLDECAETIKHLWTQIAEYFKDYSDYLIFEGFNEYLGGSPYELDEDGNIAKDSGGKAKIAKDLPPEEAYKWTNTLNQAFVDAVRATGGNNEKRILIASGYWTNIDNTTKPDFKMPTDTVEDRLMVSVHYVDNASYWSGQIGGKNWIEYSKSQLELLKNAFTEKNIPVFIGETTSIYGGDRFVKNNAIVKTTYEALDYMLRLIKSYGFVPVLWDTNDNFYSRTQYKIKLMYNESVIKKLSQELKDGTFTAPETPTAAPSSSNSTTPSNKPTEPTSNTQAITQPKVTPPASTNVIKPAKVKKVMVIAKKKKLNVSWKKVSGATGYEVKAATNNKFTKNKKTTTVKKNNATLKKLKAKKKYFVKVRAFKTVKGEKYVGKWSKVVKKKTK